MPSGSKIFSVRRISCTWYWMVRRSSNNQVVFGPTPILRVFLCAITRVRKSWRSRA